MKGSLSAPRTWGVRNQVSAPAALVFTLLLLLWGIAMWAVLGDALRSTARSAATATATEVANGLRTRPPADVVPSHAPLSTERLIQVVAPDGRVLAASHATALGAPVSSLAAPAEGVSTQSVSELPGIDADRFVIAVTAATDSTGQRLRVIVAEPQHVEEGTLAWLTFLLALGAGALLVTLIWALRSAIGAALRPVETMRSQVAEISTAGTDTKVVIPPGGDELTALGTTMNAMLDRLRASDSARRAFVADAGHELRNPLTTIRLALDRAAVDNLPEGERTEVIDRARNEAIRLSTLVNDMLVLATLDEQGTLGSTTLLDLDDLALSRVRLARDAGLHVELDLEPVQVRGDARRLERVVVNLLDNAMRHRREAVRVSVSRQGRRTQSEGAGRHTDAVLTVDNDGPVIPIGERERVFERFARVDEVRHRDTGGSGLGLAIVADIVHAHGGEVVAGEAPDGWCRFEVRLPEASSAP